MDVVNIKNKVIEELDLLPEGELLALYRLIHYFRLGLATDQNIQNGLSEIPFSRDGIPQLTAKSRRSD